MKPKYLYMLLGYPGSGKTYFSTQLASDIGAVRINADAMRVAALGTIEEAREFDSATGLLNKIVFGALDYVTIQVLNSGNSVLCDYQHNEKAIRNKKYRLAADNKAIPIVIWLQAPRDVAIERGSIRDERQDQRQHSVEKMEALVDKYIDLIEAPDEGESVIVIDGTLPYVEQYASFSQQLAQLNI